MQSEKNDDLSQAITATPPGHDFIHPSTGFSEKALSDNDPADDDRVTKDPEHARPPAPIEIDGGYGWICVMCVFLINAHTWGINSSYGVFLAHYLATNTFPGASDLDFAFVGGLSLSMAQFIAPVATITTRALCFGLGMGMQFSATVGIIPQWFTRRRSLANGIATAGSGIGGLIYSLATSAMIQRWGIGWTFRILAIVSAATPEFQLTLAWGCFSVLGYVALLLSIPDYASTVGLTASQGSILGAMFNLGGGLGRPVIGYVSDSFGRLNTALACTFLAGLFSLLIWIFAKSFGVLIFYALICGPVAATFTTTVAPVGAEIVGLQPLPSALSIFWLSVVIPSTFAEPIALWLRTDNATNFLHAQIFVGFVFMAACICLWLVRAWKIIELEKADPDGDPLKRVAQIRDNDAVPQEPVARTASSIPSVTSKAKGVKGLFTMARV
ncbi:major facilitator superfamily domain-containing protein [Penicillium verhagenii]|nr:major facilitator superfamily domain-containing protein [Penicillium verhagenii]